MIGYANGRIHEMTALLVRRARLEKLHLASIRAGYKYLFVEGRELLRRSIDEYKIESMQKYKNKKIEHDEDMEQILKDIKKEIDSRYK